MAFPDSEDPKAYNPAEDKGNWFTKLAKKTGLWVTSQASGLWLWAKKHPILASTLVAGIIAAAAFPPLYALLPTVPYFGPLVLGLIASAPYWAAPITFAATVASTAIFSATTYLVVNVFKKLLGSKWSKSSSDSTFNEPLFDNLENNENYDNFDITKPQVDITNTNKGQKPGEDNDIASSYVLVDRTDAQSSEHENTRAAVPETTSDDKKEIKKSSKQSTPSPHGSSQQQFFPRSASEHFNSPSSPRAKESLDDTNALHLVNDDHAEHNTSKEAAAFN